MTSPSAVFGESLIGRRREELDTPPLLLDLDAFEWNIANMSAFLKEWRRGIRPHGEMHKSPDIGKALVKAGAAGSCGRSVNRYDAIHCLRGDRVEAVSPVAACG